MNAQRTVQEANIKISRSGDALMSLSVNMPIWNKPSDDEKHLKVILPLLGIETVAKNESDIQSAVNEAIFLFCFAAEEHGQGLEKELQALGWVACSEETGEPLLGYNLNNPDEVLERIFETADIYTNDKLALA